MENKSLITRPATVPTFKSKELNTATKAIYEVAENVYATAMDGNKRICIILARVEKTKAYKEDGFKSLADYCGAIGFDKSKVHKMENAGRLYDSENQTVKEFAASMGYGNLAVIASASEDAIAEAVESGELSVASTQDDLRTWKTKHNAERAPEKVLPKFEIDFTVFASKGAQGFHYDAIEFENVPEFNGVAWGGVTTPDGTKVKIGLYPDGTLVKVNSMDKVKAPKAKAPKTKAAKEMTKEELIALAESMGMKVTF